jgi:hypothetical protein
MLLTGQQIVPHLHLTTSYHKVNQVGVDLSVCKIEKIYGGVQVYKEKTIVKPENFEENIREDERNKIKEEINNEIINL